MIDTTQRKEYDIYNTMIKAVDDILSNTHNINTQEKDVKNVLNILSESLSKNKQKFENDIKNLKQNSEWDKYTIAFFGETNAGKSTIIESLRILGNEDVKKEEYKKIESFLSELNQNKQKSKSLDHTIESNHNELINISSELNNISNSINELTIQENILSEGIYDKKQQLIEENIKKESELNSTRNIEKELIKKERELQRIKTKLENKIKQIERHKQSILFKIKLTVYNWFSRTYKIDESEIDQLEEDILNNNYNIEDLNSSINTLQIQYKKTQEICEELQKNIESINKEYHEIKSKIKDLNNKSNSLNTSHKKIKEEYNNHKKQNQDIKNKIDQINSILRNCGDGQIIGTGKQDFTTDVLSYNFKFENMPVTLIDVPGIEGNEGKYEQMIGKAISKAHAVFYINGSSKKPEQGTIEKIKKYLKDQTEVFSIINVRGKADSYEFEEDQKSLEITHKDLSKNACLTEQEIKNTLGSRYAKHLNVQGLMAFSSLAKHIHHERQDLIRTQKNFVEYFNGNKNHLQSLSNINKLRDIIIEQSPIYKQKIKRANHQKAIGSLNDLIKDLNEQLNNNISEEKIAFVENQFNEIELFIRNEINIFDQKIRNYISSKSNNFTQKIREFIHHIIDKKYDESYHMFSKHSYEIKQIYTLVKEKKEKNDINKYVSLFIEENLKIFVEEDLKPFINQNTKILNNNIDQRISKAFSRINEYTKISNINITLNISSALSKLDFNFNLGDIFNAVSTIGSMAMTGVAIGTLIPGIGNIIGGIIGAIVGAIIYGVKSLFGGETKESKAKRELEPQLKSLNIDLNKKLDSMADSTKIEITKTYNKYINELKTNSKNLKSLRNILQEKVSNLETIK